MEPAPVAEKEQTTAQKFSFLATLLATELAYLIASAGCSFTISNKVVKPFIIILMKTIMAYELNMPDTLHLLGSIPFNGKTVSRRIEKFSEFLECETINRIKASPLGFCLQLDESTDVTNVARLVAFVR